MGSSELASLLKISRQTTASHLKRLVEAGKLSKTGSTRSAQYHVAGKNQVPKIHDLVMVKNIKGLQEHEVFVELEHRLPLRALLSKPVREIAQYAFSEMLNNAIDHSRSTKVTIEVKLEKGIFEFHIRDSGIGVFKNVQTHFHLDNEYEAAEHLFKGKQTTDPKNHSGQGIFFTSRIADRFGLYSHGLEAVIDNEKDDVALFDKRYQKGTLVSFSIKQKSKKTLLQLFQEYANEDYEFDRSDVRIRLRTEADLISRSQARRLLAGLESYRQLTFDFKGVTGLGQAFADEIFRVFQNRHPGIRLSFLNASPAVEFMILRVRDSNLRGHQKS